MEEKSINKEGSSKYKEKKEIETNCTTKDMNNW